MTPKRAPNCFPNAVWISWENQRRNNTLSAELGVELYQLSSRLPRFLRYAILPWPTLYLLVRYRPRPVFVQNPSLLLAFIAISYGRLTSTPVVMDAHNAGLSPLEGRSALLNRFARYLMRHATLTVVTNDALASLVLDAGGHPAVLPDPLPNFELKLEVEKPSTRKGAQILFICTWAADEPYSEVIKAAHLLNPETRILITGNYTKAHSSVLDTIPQNVELLGFVDEARFQALLLESDVIMDLTTRENCLVCGAYEAVALHKPLITSDTRALRQFFYKGATYTTPAPDSIARAIREAIARRQELHDQAAALSNELRERFIERKDAFVRAIRSNLTPDRSN